MADWIQQYTAALEARDVREQAHRPYIDAYTALADRTAQLLRQSSPVTTSVNPDATSQALPSHERTSTPTKGKEHMTNPSELLATLRADLATTQKARSTLQAQLADLTAQLSAVSTQQRSSQSQVTALIKQVLEAERGLQDRDEELKGKSKLVEQAQDEMVALELQFNLAEQRSEKLERENKELVERWMKKMGEEAERSTSKPFSARNLSRSQPDSNLEARLRAVSLEMWVGTRCVRQRCTAPSDPSDRGSFGFPVPILSPLKSYDAASLHMAVQQALAIDHSAVAQH
ncbi:hypothetical protein Q7P35_012475 [Cladosporium inversicolor]